MSLIARWREIPIPARKTEYEGKHLILKENPDRYEIPGEFWAPGYFGLPDLVDSIVLLVRRCNAKDTMHSPVDVSHWGTIRVCRIRWTCQCGSSHEWYIPESWLDEGKAVFVEKITVEN